MESVFEVIGEPNHRDIGPPGLVTTVGWRDRGSASCAAADRGKAPASAARGRFPRIHSGRTAPSRPAETWTTSGGRCLAGSVPPVLGAAGWQMCFAVPDRLLSGTPIGRTVCGEATKLRSWQRLNAEYAEQFGAEMPNWPPQAAQNP
jgi:hypothetical protein